ncbi:MAG TPA: diguanylate cyclase [Gemmatimonadales bacterium]|nr:diguanylate cyclase [Gemmatimonadales bacterium]
MNEQAREQPSRPKVLLVGDASARPEGLERALTRAGFQLVEREDPAVDPAADAILVTLSSVYDPTPLALLGTTRGVAEPPRLVLISSANPDGPAAALALGAADALVAPIHFPELCARLYARIQDYRQSTSDAGSRETARSVDSYPAQELNGRAPADLVLESAPGHRIYELEQRVQEEFARARRYSLSFSLVLLGIDELQSADEKLGAEAAARLRDEVGQTLRRELRVPDLVVPYGTDEFAIVLPETGQTGARQSVLRVRERLTSLPFGSDPRLEATRFSAGIVTYPHPAAFQPDDLFSMAEAALMRGRAQSSERIGVAL